MAVPERAGRNPAASPRQRRGGKESADENKNIPGTNMKILILQFLTTLKLNTSPPIQTNNLARLSRLFWLAPAAILLLLNCFSQMRAATPVCGIISGETWTSNGSPYRVTCDITVFGLNIQPGVQVLFENNYVFEVQGLLIATGTVAQPVVFTRTNGGWQGIFFNHSLPGCELRHCVISQSLNSAIRLAVENPPLLNNCVIENNSAPAAGGGIQALNLAGDLNLEECTIRRNTVNLALVSGNDRAGGGIYATMTGGSLVLRNCTIAENRSNSRTIDECGVTMRAYGGGIYCANGGVTLSNCSVTNNTVWSSESGPCGNEHNYGYGGGIYFSGTQSRITLLNCIVAANTAYNGGSDPRGYGNGVYINSGTCRIENCTIARNGSVTDRNTDGLYNNAGSVGVTNSIFYWNSPLASVPNTYGQQIVGTVSVAYSDVQGGYAGVGNINLSPLLDAMYRIALGSPCIDAGHPDPIYNDLCFPPSRGTARNDIGAHGGPGACCWDAPCDERPPGIVRQPQGAVTCFGQTVTFCVTATGAEPLTYQWRFNNVPISGATSNCYTIDNAQANNAGAYSVVVANNFGSTNSHDATLQVFPACFGIQLYAGLSITGQVGRTYCVQYVQNIEATNWTTLTNFIYSSPQYFYLDRETPNVPRRFFRVVEGPCP
jgi:hypothetical protein